MSNVEERYASKENLIPIITKLNEKIDRLNTLTKAQIDLLFDKTTSTITLPTQKGSLTYNENSQSPEWNNYDSGKMAIGGVLSGVNAGSYTAIFTPREGFKWSDDSETGKEATWVIGKATGNIILSKNTIELSDDKESDTVTFSGNTGDVSVSSADESIATASINGNIITIAKGIPSLTLADLPDGAKIKAAGSKFYGKDLIFRKLGAGHSQDPANSVILQTKDIISVRCFDAREPNNSDSNRRYYGNNRYKYSNLLQWLNSDAGANAWYSAQHEADQKPDSASVYKKSDIAGNPYDTQAGFMNGFTADFKNSLLTVTKRTAKPVADGGGYEDVQSKFFLLSTTEIGLANEKNVAEGKLYSLFNDRTKRIMVPTQECADNSVGYAIPAGSAWRWWLRTPYSSFSYNVRCVVADGSLDGSMAYCGDYGLAPACAISKDQLVSGSVDSDGCYVLLYD